MKRFCTWLPTIILVLIPIAFFLFHACGYEVYIVNGEKYPWVVNSEELLKVDSLSNNSMELLTSLKRDGLVLSPQEYTNHTYNFFSWLLTILVAVIGIVVLVFGLNVDKKIETIQVFRQLSKSDGYMGCSTNVQQNSFNNSGNQAG